MKKIIIFISSMLILSCAVGANEKYKDAKGCYAQYNVNGKSEIYPVDKLFISENEFKIIIKNNGTSTSIINSSLIDRNKPSNFYCDNKEKEKQLKEMINKIN